jgi:hypothetical protein
MIWIFFLAIIQEYWGCIVDPKECRVAYDLEGIFKVGIS